MAAISKHKHLLDEDPDVRRWYENLARSSPITADERLRRLGRFCEATELTPKSVIAKKRKDSDAFDDFVMDFVGASLEEKEGKPAQKPSQVRNNLITLKSWLGHFGLRIERKIKLPAADYVDEVVPTKEQLATIFRHCGTRARVTASFMALCGLRPESLGNYLGTDGLRLGDIPELTIKNGEVAVGKAPTMVIVRRTLSKARHRYFTFLPEEGIQYLTEYLEARIREGERLDERSPVIGHTRAGSKLAFLRTTKLSWEVKLAVKSAGFSWRPYVLRSYCDTAFDVAEARGLLSHPWRQFFMGHKGDIEARYSTNKRRLPMNVIEEMRAAYKKCDPLLSTAGQALEQSTIVKEAKMEALKAIAKSMFDIDLPDVKVARESEEKRELSQDETIELFENELKKLRDKEKEDPQTVVTEEELDSYLKEGWQFVSVLPSRRVVIRR